MFKFAGIGNGERCNSAKYFIFPAIVSDITSLYI